jgi:hypothetical protein
MSSITHPGERNGWSQIDQDQMDCGQQWMAASDQSQPHLNDKRRIPSKDGL